MSKVVMYTREYCPFSKAAKEFFTERKVEFHEIDLNDDKALEKEMETKSGGRTDTPQIFIDSHHIGSFDDIKALDALGTLDEIL